MSMINVFNLTFAYDSSYDNIFENVSFQINTDWKLGFIGRNGRGKTTFLNLLLGRYDYSGNINASVDFEYFPYSVDNPDAMTLSIVEDILPDIEMWQIFRELNLLDTDPEILYRPFSTLSNGERTKVLLAALFLKENAFLLIDEPTNHLDASARERVAQYLNSKKGFILVSHDRVFLDRCIDHVLSINRADIEVCKGNFSSWYADKEALDKMELARNEHLKQDIRRLEASARQSSRWSDKIESTKTGTRVAGLRPDRGHIGHQAAKMMKRAKSIQSRQEQAIQEKEKLLKNVEIMDNLKLNQMKYHSQTLVSLKDISVGYASTSSTAQTFRHTDPLQESSVLDMENLESNNIHTVCSNISFEIRKGDRICLSGKNGCGKSSLLKLILGENAPSYSGELHIGSGLQISYVSQETSHLNGALSDFARQNGLDETVFCSVLRKLGFERVQFEKQIDEYSEGQKKKVLLAKSLCKPAHLFLWDEPLNFIDVFSRMQIEELLLEYQPTMLFVEHDLAFQEKIATRIIPI